MELNDFFWPIRTADFITWLIAVQRVGYILFKTALIIMFLNSPLVKLKISWDFVKCISLNFVFVTQHIHNVLRFFTAFQPFFYIHSLNRRTKWRRFWVQRIQFKWFFLKLKNIIMFLTRSLFFIFFNGHIHKVVSTWLNVL